MGVQFDRILDGFDGPFEKLTGLREGAGRQRSAARRPSPATTSATSRTTASSRSTGCSRPAKTCPGWPTVRWAPARSTSPSKPTTRAVLQKIATELGVSFDSDGDGADRRDVASCGSSRIGLFDHVRRQRCPSGWTRLMLENFEFPYEVGVSADARCGQPAREVRRADLQRRRSRRRGWRRWRAVAVAAARAAMRRRRPVADAGRGGGAGRRRTRGRRGRRRAAARWCAVARPGGGARRRSPGAASTIPRSSRKRRGNVIGRDDGEDQAVRGRGRHGRRDRRSRAPARCRCSSCRCNHS